MPPLEPGVVYDLDIIASKTPVAVSNLEELEVAAKKLGMYEQCLRAIVGSLSASEASFERSGREFRQNAAIFVLPSEAVGECRSLFAGAAEQKPPMPTIEATAHDYLESLKTINITTRDIKVYIDSSGYERDESQAGQRFARVLAKEFERAGELRKKFYSQLLAARTSLQELELSSVKSREGEVLHFHIRNVALASQALAIALSNLTEAKIHEKKHQDLRAALNAARDYLLKNPDIAKSVPPVDAFLNSIPAVSKAPPGQGVMWHNQSVEMFNRIVLP
jgi:hypothetical protein